MTEIGYYLYENVPLDVKFGWLQGMPGARATEASRVGLGNLGNQFVGSDQAVRGILAPLGMAWAGQAGDAAAQALHGAADRSGVVGAASGAGGGSVGGYGESFEQMRTKVHWEDPGSWDWWEMPADMVGVGLDAAFGDVFDIQSDYFSKVEQNRTLDAQASAALYGHEGQSRASLAGFPAVEPAAALTNDIPAGGGAGFGGGWGGGAGGSRFSPPTPDIVGDGYSLPAPTSPAGTFAPAAAVGGGSPGSTLLPDPRTGTGGASVPGIGPEVAGMPAGARGGTGMAADPERGRAGSAGATPAGTSGVALPPGSGGWGTGAAPRPGLGSRGGDPTGGSGVAGMGGRPGLGTGAGGYGGRAGGSAGTGGYGGGAGSAPGGRGYDGRTGSTLGGVGPSGGGRPGAIPGGGRYGGTGAMPGSSGRAGGWGGSGPGWASSGGSASGGPPGSVGAGGRTGGWGGMPGPEFGGRFASGASESGANPRTPGTPAAVGPAPGTGRAAVAGGHAPMPFLGGMGAGTGSGRTEHKTKYWIPSSEAFDVPLPPHAPAVIEGEDE